MAMTRVWNNNARIVIEDSSICVCPVSAAKAASSSVAVPT